tara:strand:+ start:5044 stop:5556 length:513 start_codon:yes stop_codon:yes gene_type:complete
MASNVTRRNTHKFALDMPFHFEEETANRTYFRDADDSDAPFKWDTFDTESTTTPGDTISILGSTAVSGIAIPYDCTLKGVRWIAYQSQNYNQVVHLQTWTGVPAETAPLTTTVTLRDSISLTDYKRKGINQYSALNVSLSAGAMIYPAFKYDSGTAVHYHGSVSFLFETV